ncbi:unnamed protein product [Tuber melanosporum]|uniref:(Perigord truffle) hypothetical protein n=1 Tax=Tuber melanosporum (strain Mel28) TaxID=656061 RepID=D5G7H0_TUBMM|nr:uncharacterized protein GSTUM_00002460001 [Tuber melanosporum]CAZ80463.1 unnamed protein product [Tuber melanosporum]
MVGISIIPYRQVLCLFFFSLSPSFPPSPSQQQSFPPPNWFLPQIYQLFSPIANSCSGIFLSVLLRNTSP